MELAEQLISGAVNEMVFSKQLISAVGSYLALSAKRYSSCRYNERQLIDVTVVRRVRPRAERWCDCEGHRRWCPLYVCSFFFCNTPPISAADARPNQLQNIVLPALFHLRCPSQSHQRAAYGRTRLTTVISISCRSL